MQQTIYCDQVQIGDSIPPREHGPLTIVDTVRWAGLQENVQHLHFDRDHVRQHNGLPTFIASGAYRQALLIRMLTDWIGPAAGYAKSTCVTPIRPSRAIACVFSRGLLKNRLTLLIPGLFVSSRAKIRRIDRSSPAAAH